MIRYWLYIDNRGILDACYKKTSSNESNMKAMYECETTWTSMPQVELKENIKQIPEFN